MAGFKDYRELAAWQLARDIAEGFARYRHKEFAQFVRIAEGSEAAASTSPGEPSRPRTG
jgi:hypothetical protein